MNHCFLDVSASPAQPGELLPWLSCYLHLSCPRSCILKNASSLKLFFEMSAEEETDYLKAKASAGKADAPVVEAAPGVDKPDVLTKVGQRYPLVSL